MLTWDECLTKWSSMSGGQLQLMTTCWPDGLTSCWKWPVTVVLSPVTSSVVHADEVTVTTEWQSVRSRHWGHLNSISQRSEWSCNSANEDESVRLMKLSLANEWLSDWVKMKPDTSKTYSLGSLEAMLFPTDCTGSMLVHLWTPFKVLLVNFTVSSWSVTLLPHIPALPHVLELSDLEVQQVHLLPSAPPYQRLYSVLLIVSRTKAAHCLSLVCLSPNKLLSSH